MTEQITEGMIRVISQVHLEFKIFCARRRLTMLQAASDALLEYMVRREDAEREPKKEGR